MPDSHPVLKSYETLTEGLAALNVNPTTALEHNLNLELYGFIQDLNRTWPKNKTIQTVGLYMRTAVLDGLEAMSLGPLGRGLGESKEEVQVYLVHVRKCLMDNSMHSYFPFHVSYGQKPENEMKDERIGSLG
jgi:hypothetical protein